MKTQLMQGPFNLKIKAALNHDESNEYYIVDQSGFHLAKVYNCNGQFNEAYQVAQAEQVLKAVNMHDELIYLLNTIRQKIGITNVLSKNELDNINCLLEKEVQIK